MNSWRPISAAVWPRAASRATSSSLGVSAAGTRPAVAETCQPLGYPVTAYDRAAPVVRIHRPGEHFNGGAAGRRCDSGGLGGHCAEEPIAEPVQGICGLGGGGGGNG